MPYRQCQGRPLPERPPDFTVDKVVFCRGNEIILNGPVPGDRLSRYRLAEGLHCFRPPCKQRQALAELALQPDGLVFTARIKETVIAYAALQKPEYPWWRSRRLPCLLEMGSLETDPMWRRSGIASALIDGVFSIPYFDHFIVFAVPSPDNWDLQGTGMEPWAYRRLMCAFLKKYGFYLQVTLDPEIREVPGSLLLVRAGRFVHDEDKERFIEHCLHPE